MNSSPKLDGLLKLLGLMFVSIFTIYLLLGNRKGLEALNDPILRKNAAMIVTAAILVTSLVYFKFIRSSVRMITTEMLNLVALSVLTLPFGVYLILDKLIVAESWFMDRIIFYSATLMYIEAIGILVVFPRFFNWYMHRGEMPDELSRFARLKANASMKIFYTFILLGYRLTMGFFNIQLDASTVLEEILAVFLVSEYLVEPVLVRYYINQGEN